LGTFESKQQSSKKSAKSHQVLRILFIYLFIYYFFWNHHILDKRFEQVANQNIAQFLKISSLFSDL